MTIELLFFLIKASTIIYLAFGCICFILLSKKIWSLFLCIISIGNFVIYYTGKNKLEINVEAFITNKIDLIRSIFIFIELGLVIATLLVLVLFFFYLIFKENDFGKQQSIKFN